MSAWHAGIGLALESRGLTYTEDAHYLIAHTDHATLAAAMRDAGLVADALVVDAPYSARVHDGHDNGAANANAIADDEPVDNLTRYARGLPPIRRPLPYAAWGRDDVDGFCGAWSDVVRGWIGSMTDHLLAPEWATLLEMRGRYTFSPIACVEPGSRVRLSGDGPAQWSTWLVVARPRTREWQSWGALRGAYVVPPGGRGVQAGRRDSDSGRIPGGKPLWLMRAIVGDYSRPGDLVVDPCMGAGTTLVAAVELGRRAIGCEPDAGRFEMAAKRLAKARPQMRMRLDVEAVDGEQSSWSMPRGGVE